jgi:hypothetical protein
VCVVEHVGCSDDGLIRYHCIDEWLQGESVVCLP